MGKKSGLRVSFISMFVGVSLLFFSCSREERVPAGILPPSKMVSILTDIHELEAKVGYLKLDYDSATALFAQQQALIFEKHNVDDSLYNKSFDFFLTRVELMNKVYEAVVDSLSLRRNMESRPKTENAETDEPI